MSHPIAQPLRPLTEAEHEVLQRVRRAPSETVIRHQRAVALLAVADGMSLIEAARAAGWRVHDTVTRLIRRFNERGLAALDDLPRSGHPRRYGSTERAYRARIATQSLAQGRWHRHLVAHDLATQPA